MGGLLNVCSILLWYHTGTDSQKKCRALKLLFRSDNECFTSTIPSCGVLYCIVLVLEKLPVNKKKERILFALFYKLLSPLLIGGSSNIHLLSRDQLLPTISQENHSACQVTFLLPENSSIFG